MNKWLNFSVFWVPENSLRRLVVSERYGQQARSATVNVCDWKGLGGEGVFQPLKNSNVNIIFTLSKNG